MLLEFIVFCVIFEPSAAIMDQNPTDMMLCSEPQSVWQSFKGNVIVGLCGNV